MKKVISFIVALIILSMSIGVIASEIEFIDIYTAGELEYYIKDGILYIQGTGDMPDFDYINGGMYSPFNRFQRVKRVVIKEGVKSIGHSAFRSSGLEEITIPKSVVKIGENAFYGCDELKKVIFEGDGLETVGNYAFLGCVQLEECKLPESVKYIDSAAFHCCYKLKEIVVGDNVEYVYPNAFEYCKGAESIYIGKSMKDYMLDLQGLENIKTFTVSEENIFYTIIDNVLFSKDKKTLIKFPSGSEITEYTVPDFAKEVNKSAFYKCDNLKIVILPEHIDHTTLRRPETLRFMGEGVYERYSVMEYMGDTIYYTKGDIRFDIHQVKDENGDKSFKLHEIFGECTDARIDPTVYTIDNIETVDASLMNNIPEWLFRESLVNEVILPDDLKVIDQLRFYNCDNLKSITLPESLERIERFAFSSTALEEITIPKNVNYIGEGAFSSCANLKTIVIEEGNLKILGTGTPMYYSLHSFNNIASDVTVFLPESLEWISDNEFKRFEYRYRGMIGWQEFPENMTIVAPEKSAAHTWATTNNIDFMTP